MYPDGTVYHQYYGNQNPQGLVDNSILYSLQVSQKGLRVGKLWRQSKINRYCQKSSALTTQAIPVREEWAHSFELREQDDQAWSLWGRGVCCSWWGGEGRLPLPPRWPSLPQRTVPVPHKTDGRFHIHNYIIRLVPGFWSRYSRRKKYTVAH